MNRVLHIAIMLAVATHMVFGCCWHHAHATGTASGFSLDAESTRCPCEHDGHHHGRQTCDHDHEKEHGCGEHSCIFTRSDAPEGSDLLAALQDFVLVSVLPAIAESSWNVAIAYVPSELSGAMPLHLLNQVLLI